MGEEALCWLDGRLVPPADALASWRSPSDALGVFETIRVENGAAFALTRHLNRLRASASALRVTFPGDEPLVNAITEVIHANEPSRWAKVRVTVFARDGGPTAMAAYSTYREKTAPSRIVTLPWPKNEYSALAGVKSTSYAENAAALSHAVRRGAGEGIFLNTSGYLCEGTGSNLFVVTRDGRLLTPSLESGCLPGITRSLVLEWVGGEERRIRPEVLHEAAEVFLTSSTRGVRPVGEVDGRRIAPSPGPVTSAAMRRYASMCAADVDP